MEAASLGYMRWWRAISGFGDFKSRFFEYFLGGDGPLPILWKTRVHALSFVCRRVESSAFVSTLHICGGNAPLLAACILSSLSDLSLGLGCVVCG